MKLLDLTLPTPAGNLACDEALLDSCEAGNGQTLRFWESPVPFVVVGYANKVELEVNERACRDRGIPILRRCSGGGTVVQGPGCLNYAVTLRIPEAGPLTNVTGTNQFVMERNRAALEQVLGTPVSVQGHTDLALAWRNEFWRDELHESLTLRVNPLTQENPPHPSREPRAAERVWRKFSGNSQRRRRSSVLFHGTILYAFDLSLLEILLPMPSKQPEYRSERPHSTFVTNLPASAGEIRAALRSAWKANETAPLPDIAPAMWEKYGRIDWSRA